MWSPRPVHALLTLLLSTAACGTGAVSPPAPAPAAAPAPPAAPAAAAAPAWQLPALQSPELGWWRDSMTTREARIGWFREARFGMFIHWGVYSHAGGIWNGKPVEGYAEHLMRKQKLTVEQYRTELAAKFDPTAFDAEAWVKAAKDAGMRYLVITAKHHDGFAMYDSTVSDFNVVKATPWKRDPMLELKQACARQGLRFGFYYSHARDWTDGPIEDWDRSRTATLAPAAWARRYVDRKVIPQVQELIVKYDPDIFWFDTPEKLSPAENLRVLRAAREAKPTLVVSGRVVQVGPGVPPARFGDYVSTTDKPAEFPPPPGGFPDWEGIPTTNESYGWHQGDQSHKPPGHFIGLLAKAAARGGNLLLNIGPMGTGAFDPKDQAILQGIGAWMKVNGESIHGTTATPLPVQAWGESTRKGNTLYLHVMTWPARGRVVVGGLRSKIKRAFLLSAPRRALPVQSLGEPDVLVRGPDRAPDPVDTVIALELDGEPRTDPARLVSVDVQRDVLRAFDGRIAGPLAFARGKTENAFVEHWTAAEGRLSWPLRARERATYDLGLVYDADEKSVGAPFQVAIAGKSFAGTVAATARAPVRVGRVTLDPGAHELVVTGTPPAGGELFRVRGAVLELVQRGPSPPSARLGP
jgi:alpha-L-fucosidase